MTVLITFFPITITVFDGFKSVKTEMEELLFTFGADKRQIFMKLKVPGCPALLFLGDQDGGSVIDHRSGHR